MNIDIVEATDVAPAMLTSAEALVRSSFGDEFRTHDWLHAVHGVHVFLTSDSELIAHASVVPRTLWYGDLTYDTGYVEAMAVAEAHQGLGLGRIVMDQVETIIRTRHALGALNAVKSASDFYCRRGWQPWSGQTGVCVDGSTMDTSNADDRILLWPSSPRQLPSSQTSALVCDWRAGDAW